MMNRYKQLSDSLLSAALGMNLKAEPSVLGKPRAMAAQPSALNTASMGTAESLRATPFLILDIWQVQAVINGSCLKPLGAATAYYAAIDKL